MTESTAHVAKTTRIRGLNEHRAMCSCAHAKPCVGIWLAARNDHALDLEEMAA